MNKVTGINPEQVWEGYKDIETTIQQFYKLPGNEKDYEVDPALQRIWQAIKIRYHLERTDFPKIVYNNKLQAESIQRMDLSTSKAMVDARIPEWEDEIPSDMLYYGALDDYVGYEGRTAAFRPQKSLQQVLKENEKRDYFEIKAIVSTKPEEAWKIYEGIEKTVKLAIQKFSLSTNSTLKINRALQRLCQAVLLKYQMRVLDNRRFDERLDAACLNKTDLYNIRTMLDAKLRITIDSKYKICPSLREELDDTEWMIVKVFKGDERSDILRNVEEELYKSFQK